MVAGRWRAAALAAFAILATLTMSGCGGRSTASTSDRCSRHATPATTSSTARFGHLRIEVPQDWYATQACFNASGTSVPLGYLTTQHPIAQCRIRSAGAQGHESCGDPVGRLGEQDVLVSVNQEASRVPEAVPIADVARADLQSHRDNGSSDERYVMTEHLRTPDGYITIAATCGSRERTTVRRILRSVRYVA
jgi:hypothetical protein